MDVTAALLELAPGASWSVRDGDYNQIQWNSPNIPKPTREQVEKLYLERTELIPKTSALKYEKHKFYGVYTDIGRLEIYRRIVNRKY